MAAALDLEIVTPEAVVLRDRAVDFYIPAFYGEAGILSHHLPYISVLKTGEISYLDLAGRRHYFFITNGFLEVRDNRIVVIADRFERGEELKPEELQAQLAETEALIQSSFAGKITPEQLEKELERQLQLRLKLAITDKIRKR